MRKTKALINELYRNGLITSYLHHITVEDEDFVRAFKNNLSNGQTDITTFYKTLLGEHYDNVLSKVEFVTIMNSLEEINKLKSNVKSSLNSIAANFKVECYDPSFSNAIHETMILSILKRMFNDKMDDIEYFLYELDYGHKFEGGYTINDIEVPLSNARELYDLLVSRFIAKS